MADDLTFSDVNSGDDVTLAGVGPQRRREQPIAKGTIIGRYLVLGRLGAGGMGVVYAAYDPELDRKVAVKLLHVAPGGRHSSEGRTRLMREAQALAKLSHPNVVAVYDVGTMDERVWMAMEFVTGQTLDAWLSERPRPWREVLRVMGMAGEGLAAAHEVGLLHRDFKPDNVMIDTSGRVRVMDFGLARAGSDTSLEASGPGISERSGPLSQRVTEVGSLMGTPGYMSPEQFAGKEADARSDQFAVCVTLWEALYGRRPFEGEDIPELAARVLEGKLERPPSGVRVPGWLRRVCVRGLATDPQQRFASVRVLRDALARGQARARHGAMLVGLTALSAIGVGALGRAHWEHARQVTACETEGASITEVWNDDARTRLRAGILATGVSHAATTVDKVLPWIDGEAEAWREHQTRACMNGTVEQRWNAEVLQRASACLDERRLGIESLVHVLTEADDGVVQHAVKAATTLDPSASCLDAAALERAPPPPDPQLRPRIADVMARLAHARVLRRAGEHDAGLQVIAEVRDEVAALGWGPLSAKTAALESRLLQAKGSFAPAEAAGIAAYMAAAESGAWADAADIAAVLVHLVGYSLARPAEGRLWAEHAEMAASRAGDPLRLHEALRDNGLAMVAFSTGAHDEARARYETALAIQRSALGPHHPEVATLLTNLGILASSRGSFDEAKRAYEEARVILADALGPEHPEMASIVGNLGVLYYEAGDFPEAKASFERALAIEIAVFGPDHPDTAASLDNLAAVSNRMGDREGALAMQLRALAAWERAVGPDHPSVAVSARLLAQTYAGQQRLPEALAALERAVAIFDHHDGIQHGEPEAHFALAELLVEMGGDRARALVQAEAARAGYRELGEGKAADLAKLEAWITDVGE